MTFRNTLGSFLILMAGCGDNGSTMTTTTTVGSMTLTSTVGPSTGTSGEDATTSTDPTSSTSSTPTSNATTTEEGGPEFLSFKSNVSEITEGESVIFTALVTDPDGVGDIIGGSLLSDDESIDFGPFVAAGQEGTYSITLSWAQIHQASPISFENTDFELVLRARFFDQGGHQAVKSANISLVCAGGSACDGACTDLAADSTNCGTCGHQCASKECAAADCTPILSECFTAKEGLNTCAEICQSVGETCAESQCDGFTTAYFGTLQGCMDDEDKTTISDSCDKVQTWATAAIRCCCTDPN